MMIYLILILMKNTMIWMFLTKIKEMALILKLLCLELNTRMMKLLKENYLSEIKRKKKPEITSKKKNILKLWRFINFWLASQAITQKEYCLKKNALNLMIWRTIQESIFSNAFSKFMRNKVQLIDRSTNRQKNISVIFWISKKAAKLLISYMQSGCWKKECFRMLLKLQSVHILSRRSRQPMVWLSGSMKR